MGRATLKGSEKETRSVEWYAVKTKEREIVCKQRERWPMKAGERLEENKTERKEKHPQSWSSPHRHTHSATHTAIHTATHTAAHEQ